MKATRKVLAVAMGAALVAAAGSAQAFTWPYLGEQLWEDDYFEVQFNDINGNNFLEVGDTLRGITDVIKITKLGVDSTTLTGRELGAIFEVRVDSRTFVEDGADNVLGTADDLYDYVFKPVAGDTGVIFTFYTDDANDEFPSSGNCDSLTACEGFVDNGDVAFTFGFTGDLDEQWNAFSAPQSPAIFQGLSTEQAVGQFRFALGVIDNNTSLDVGLIDLDCAVYACGGAGDDKVNFLGSGDIRGTRQILAANPEFPYDVSGDVDFTINLVQRVPEPGTVLLMAAGLLGLGGSMRKRRS